MTFPITQRNVSEWQFSRRGTACRLFITCWLVYALHFATNTVREIYPALSLGDRMSFDVTEYTDLHPDIFEIPGRGVFINSNPGASILGALPYTLTRPLIDWIVERINRSRDGSPELLPKYDIPFPLVKEFYRKAYERGLDVKLGLAAGVMQALLMAPLSAFSAVLMFYILVSLTGSIRTALLLALLYAFATPVFYRTAQLNQNLLVGHSAFFAFALLWRPWKKDASPLCASTSYLGAGLLCGWAVVLDYSGLVVLSVLGLYALVRVFSLRKKTRVVSNMFSFVIGVTVAISVLMAYQWLYFGHPLYPAQHYMPPTPFSRYGYNGLNWPDLRLLWETAFGMRFGLFISAPLLLMSLYIPGWFQRTRIVAAQETWLIIIYSVVFFLFSASIKFGYLQFNSGVRYIVPVVPFLFLLSAGVLLRMPKLLATIVGIAATYWSWCLAMYRDVEHGLGIPESIIHVTLEGPRLPWIKTLERMNYVTTDYASSIVIALAAIVLWSIWALRTPRIWPYSSGLQRQI